MSVVVAHQHSATGEIALLEGAREARLRQTDLVVINVVESLDLDSREALVASLTDEIREKLQAADLVDVNWKVHLGVEADDVAGLIISLAEQDKADVLVIGARKRSPLGKFLLGSTVQSIILNAPMPVLVVKVSL